jgi:hypothetical protein
MLLFTPSAIFAETEDGQAGFIPSNIWYSNPPDTVGEKIKIYTVIFNPYPSELSGSVSFYDGEVLLGKKTFSISTTGTKDISVDWVVTLGTHKIFAKIEHAKYLKSKGVYEQVAIKENTSETSSYTVYKKILPDVEDVKQNLQSTVESIKTPVSNIGEKIADHTPAYIAEPVATSTNVLENWRKGESDLLDMKKEEVIAEINAAEQPSITPTFLKEAEDSSSAEDAPTKPKEKTSLSSISTPFAYAKLFFFTLLSYVFTYTIVFYGVLLFLVFIILRFIYRKILRR